MGSFMIKAVLFDLDGTLVNSLSDLANAVNFALGAFGFKPHETEEFKYFVGDGIPMMIKRALPENSRDFDTVEKVKKVFFEHYSVHFADNTLPYDGVKELISALKQREIKIAVVTNKAQEMADKVVFGAYGDVFDIVFGKREGIPSKPDPAAAITVMNDLGVKPEECIFIGDSGVDVLTGVNSGAVPVGELWGYREEEELLNGGAKYIIKKPEELLGIIDEIDRSKKT